MLNSVVKEWSKNIYEIWFRYDSSTGNIIIINEVELPSGRKLKNSAALMECPYCKRFLMK